ADRTLYGVEGKHGEDEHLYAYQGADDGVGLDVAEVGSYQPNAWGFHDMLGNVAEFCADLYKPEIDGGVDPLDQYLQSDRKIHQRVGVYRGGAWCTTPNLLNHAHRGFSIPRSSAFLGVRLVLRQGERRAKTAAEIHAELKVGSQSK
ncbi:MAG: formylglycine-generating enzyme family protein, partial [Planctomycetales bacterium]